MFISEHNIAFTEGRMNLIINKKKYIKTKQQFFYIKICEIYKKHELILILYSKFYSTEIIWLIKLIKLLFIVNLYSQCPKLLKNSFKIKYGLREIACNKEKLKNTKKNIY